jgi:multicomponent Na+:H+ antiporter subunit F
MIDTIITALLIPFIVSVLISLYRLVTGPTIPDRILAIDVMSYSLAVIMGLVAVLLESSYLIVISFTLALWYYVGSLYIARYMEGEKPGD